MGSGGSVTMKEPLNKLKLLESDLYPPIRDFLNAQGYRVRGEVEDCDLAASKDDELLVVELKRHLSVELLVQAVKRQKVADLVYIAVPKPGHLKANAKWRDLLYLLRRLGLGLLLVNFKGETALVEVVIEPGVDARQGKLYQNKRKRTRLTKELAGRSLDANLGGVNRKKLLTAYREQAVLIACYLKYYGNLSPKRLRELGTDPKKTTSILYDNHYGWFERVSQGCYGLTDSGCEALQDYPELMAAFEKNYKLQIGNDNSDRGE